METRTRLNSGAEGPAAGFDRISAERPQGLSRLRRSSQDSSYSILAVWSGPLRTAFAPHDAATAALWALFPGVLGGVFASFAAERPMLGVALLLVHQAALLALSVRSDARAIRWGLAEWSLVGIGAAATVALADAMILPWLLLPVAPAALLYIAGRDRLLPRSVCLMRLFSIATLGTVLLQLVTSEPSPATTVALLGGAILFFAAVERIAVGDQSACGRQRPDSSESTTADAARG